MQDDYEKFGLCFRSDFSFTGREYRMTMKSFRRVHIEV